MRLFTTITSERGKPVTKSGNEAIRIVLTKDRRNMFDVIFDGDKIEVLRYFDGTIETIEYVPQE
jgi:hypothetical protein